MADLFEQEQPLSDMAFQKILMNSAKTFADVTAKTLNTILSTTYSVESVESLDGGLTSEDRMFVSILFTGTTYGEYVLALDEKVAATIIGDNILKIGPDSLDQFRDAISELFCELLNVIVGESVLGLGEVYRHITLTAPRVYFGRLKYSRIKTGKVVLSSEKGPIECYFYIDRMKLDIASSYREAMSSVLKSHQELQIAMKKLQDQQALLVQSEKLAALGTMAAGIAHEINSPLSIVIMAAEQGKDLIQDQSADLKGIHKLLEKIEATAMKVAVIIRGVLTFAQGAQDTSYKVTRIKDIIEDTLSMCRERFRNGKIQLTYSQPDDKICLNCLPTQLMQVLINFLNNAYDAVIELDEKWVKLEVSETIEFVELVITDSGVGIPESIRKKVFDPFFTTKEVGKGTGLGMSISKGIVSSHHGTIVIDSHSQNTRFVIRFPRSG